MGPTRKSDITQTDWLRPFSWAGWVLVLVVLLSAIPSAAQPRSRITGSAFDPAAVSVALNVKVREYVKAKGSEEGPASPDSRAGCGLTTVADLGVTGGIIDGAELGVAVIATRLARRTMGPLGQRAPPVR